MTKRDSRKDAGVPTLHEWQEIGEYEYGYWKVSRLSVPGGWIYRIREDSDGTHMIFVPKPEAEVKPPRGFPEV